MSFIVYIIVYPIIWILSILPLRILYFISDIIYLKLFYIIGYRKKVVLANLKLAFPTKSEKELKKIRKKFYKHFVDIFIEMIKSFNISKTELSKRYKLENLSVIEESYSNNRSVVLVGAHYANWEWIFILNSVIKFKGYGAYTRIGNKYLNEKILSSRSVFGTNLIPTAKFREQIQKNIDSNELGIYGLLSDQSPQLKKTHYWGTFFGVKVPVHTGAENIAKKYDMDIVLLKTKKIKRGYYSTSFELISNEPRKYNNYELTDIFLRKVEEQIKEEPSYYFWTHKRFKHKDKAPK